MNMATPESDHMWIKWFSHLKNIRTVAFICSYELWLEMAIEQTVRVWTSKAAPELQRMEFWCSIYHVILTDDFDVGTVWVDEGRSYNDTFISSIVKEKGGFWNVLKQGEIMSSGPRAKKSTSVLELFML